VSSEDKMKNRLILAREKPILLFLNKKSMFFTEVSHVVQVRAEGPKAPSPGHRPGYNGNQQDAL
jgi:hypothetical protein